ncbi:hypothetical protein T4D_6061 [Trichinella pseudospiralis]|uniref:Uncharacterized protein n=1 Tax=Trichinella pseudospiralis TaxID=6337 RepID=A0A0V1FGZ7_TRIPS|nr:hypothetical protein T4D_6061 [Trichinella pseudospiralis]
MKFNYHKRLDKLINLCQSKNTYTMSYCSLSKHSYIFFVVKVYYLILSVLTDLPYLKINGVNLIYFVSKFKKLALSMLNLYKSRPIYNQFIINY